MAIYSSRCLYSYICAVSSLHYSYIDKRSAWLPVVSRDCPLLCYWPFIVLSTIMTIDPDSQTASFVPKSWRYKSVNRYRGRVGLASTNLYLDFIYLSVVEHMKMAAVSKKVKLLSFSVYF